MRWSLALLGVLLGVPACGRKAPGPAECQQFSHRVAGITHSEQLARRDVRERVDELIRQCLTTPYDRELMSCVEQTGRMRACTLDFQRRKQREPADPDPPQWFVR